MFGGKYMNSDRNCEPLAPEENVSDEEISRYLAVLEMRAAADEIVANLFHRHRF
jgi:hypothetical protein